MSFPNSNRAMTAEVIHYMQLTNNLLQDLRVAQARDIAAQEALTSEYHVRSALGAQLAVAQDYIARQNERIIHLRDALDLAERDITRVAEIGEDELRKQDAEIDDLEDRIADLEDRIRDLEKENADQKDLIDSIDRVSEDEEAAEEEIRQIPLLEVD